jgi:hypothetical protein
MVMICIPVPLFQFPFSQHNITITTHTGFVVLDPSSRNPILSAETLAFHCMMRSVSGCQIQYPYYHEPLMYE